MAALTGEAVKGSVSHIAGNLGQRFRGEIRHGNMGAQIGYSMRQEAAKIKELREGKANAAGDSASSAGTCFFRYSPSSRIKGMPT